MIYTGKESKREWINVYVYWFTLLYCRNECNIINQRCSAESCPKASDMEPRNKVISGTVWAPWSLLFSRSVVSDSLRLHGLQDTSFPCPLVSPRVCSTHMQWVGDANQPSHSLLPPSPPTLNLFQHQGQWIGCSHQVAKVLELQLQNQSFQWIFRVDFL